MYWSNHTYFCRGNCGFLFVNSCRAPGVDEKIRRHRIDGLRPPLRSQNAYKPRLNILCPLGIVHLTAAVTHRCVWWLREGAERTFELDRSRFTDEPVQTFTIHPLYTCGQRAPLRDNPLAICPPQDVVILQHQDHDLPRPVQVPSSHVCE